MENRQDVLKKLKIKRPFENAGNNLRAKLTQNPDFDPVSLFEWGSAMGMAVLELLKAVEQKFGVEGQQVCREVMVGVGRRIAAEAMKDADIPPGMTPVELVSLIATWVNTRFYASLEKPRIINNSECNFDILWCPHQDVYRPFDCRVQRYFVQGILEAAREAGIWQGFNVEVKSLIPAGAETCHFRIWKAGAGEPADLWEKYTRQLEEKAMQRMPDPKM
ncbi:MAG: hypothetical protein ACOY40_05470 [Bacillota bacterium]